MDEMKISSKFTRMLLSKLAKGVLHKKLGYNVDIQLNELNASISDEKAHVHVSIDADMSKEETHDNSEENRFKLRGLSQQWLFLFTSQNLQFLLWRNS